MHDTLGESLRMREFETTGIPMSNPLSADKFEVDEVGVVNDDAFR